jgi:hypothetical protein
MKGRTCSGAAYCTPWLKKYPQLERFLSKKGVFTGRTWLDTYARISCYIKCINDTHPPLSSQDRMCVFAMRYLKKENVERLKSPFKELIEELNLESFDFFDATEFLVKSLVIRKEIPLKSDPTFERWYEILATHKCTYGTLSENIDRTLKATITSVRRRFTNGILTKNQRDRLNAIDFPFFSRCAPRESTTEIFIKNYNALKQYKDNNEGYNSNEARPFIRILLRRYEKGSLTQEQIKLLNDIHFPWDYDLTPLQVKRNREIRKRKLEEMKSNEDKYPPQKIPHMEPEDFTPIQIDLDFNESLFQFEFDLKEANLFSSNTNLFAPFENIEDLYNLN